MAEQRSPTANENKANIQRAEESKSKLLSFCDGLLSVSELGNGQFATPNKPEGDVIEEMDAEEKRDCAMDVLISWSKKQSREMASLFHEWLPQVVPELQPWMSSKDIDKGKQWFSELQDYLGKATSCIICVTSENVRSPWIYYEAGAIATKKTDVLVCPYLVGIGTPMIADGPFSQWQCTEAIKNDTLALIKSLNKALASPHNERLICGNFELKWPEFEEKLTKILEIEAAAPADFVETEADIFAGYKLSTEARTLLITAAASDGCVIYCRSSSGCNTQVGNRIFNVPHDSRSEVTWEQAIRDLIAHNLLTQRSKTFEIFEVSAKGYTVADLLRVRETSR